MIFPSTVLKNKYEELSEIFIKDINSGSITLHYPSSNALSNTNNIFLDEPKSINAYGGKVPVSNMMDRQNEYDVNVQQTNFTETIKARTYWINRKFEQNGNIISANDQCKVITKSSESEKINMAEFATIDKIKCKREGFAVSYGLFDKQYCISYWTII